MKPARQRPPSSLSGASTSGGACSTGTRVLSGRVPLAKGLVIAAPQSGSGKTVVTLGILRALRNRGVRVASAKAGPDHIDPRFHEAATAWACFNLDPWARSIARIAFYFDILAEDADILI